MIKKKENTRIFILVIFALVLSSLSVFNRTNISIFFHNTYESLMSRNPGFSSSRNLVDKGGNIDELSIIDRLHPLILNARSIFHHISDDSNKNLDMLLESSKAFSNGVLIMFDFILEKHDLGELQSIF